MELFLVFFVALGVIEEPASPPSGAEVMALAPADADIFFYADTGAIIAPAWRWIEALGGEQFIKDVPQVRKGYETGMRAMRDALSDLRAQTSLDVLKDLHHVALWAAGAPDMADFRVLVAVDGRFSPALLTTLPSTLGLTSKASVGGVTVHHDGGTRTPPMALAQLDSDTLLIGERSWVEAALGARAGVASPLARRLSAKLDRHPTLLLSITSSSGLRAAVEDAPEGVRSFFSQLAFLDVSLYHNGVDIDADLNSSDAYARFALFFNGFVDLCRASQTATRGLARAVLAILPQDDPSLDATLRALLTQRDALLDFIVRHTGDGNFTLKDLSRPADRALRLELRAAHLREIIQPAIIIGASALTF